MNACIEGWPRRALRSRFLTLAVALSAIVSGCGGGSYGGGVRADSAESPSPAPVSKSSREASQRADAGLYQPVSYANVGKKGPRIIVLPGEVKSNNASFVQRVTSNNIADFGELELGKANFTVVERSNLGPLLNEVQLAYNLGDPAQAKRVFQKGKLQTTKWIVKFDVLKAEEVASAAGAIDGGTVASLIGIFGGSGKAGAAGSVVAGSVKTSESAGTWIIGMRYKVIDANTTDQVASGYVEEKMEMGKKAGSVLGVSTGAGGQLTLDSLVQRLIQKNVAEIDAKYK